MDCSTKELAVQGRLTQKQLWGNGGLQRGYFYHGTNSAKPPINGIPSAASILIGFTNHQMEEKLYKRGDIMYLMLGNIPVFHIVLNGNFKCEVLHFDLLPYSMRNSQVSLEEFNQWMNARSMNVGRTYGKQVLNTMRLPQQNPFALCKLLHGLSLTDSYWIQEDDEHLKWKDVNFWDNHVEKVISKLCLTGIPLTVNELKLLPKRIHTPELVTQGLSPKCWVKEKEDYYLYKVGRKEIPASQILDCLGVSHLSYLTVTEQELTNFLDDEHLSKIMLQKETVVKSKLLSSKEISILSFEDFAVSCGNYDLNEFYEVLKVDAFHYHEMQIADYILNNSDRHLENWGFYMDNSNGKLLGLYPLMDHDHSFDLSEEIVSQTTDEIMSLKEAAILSQKKLQLPIFKILKMEKPVLLTNEEWEGVCQRCQTLIRSLSIDYMISNAKKTKINSQVKGKEDIKKNDKEYEG